MECKLCQIEFEPHPKQKKAWWSKNWVEVDGGLLCTDCHRAAMELNCVGNTERVVSVIPFTSDIMNLSKSPNITREKVKKTYQLETNKHWTDE